MMRLAADGHLPLLHGLEEGALHLRSRTIDFVRKDEIRKDRPLVNPEASLLRLEDHGSHHIARQKIRGELNALEIQPHGRPKAFDEKGLGKARKPFQQNVPVR